LIRLIPRARSFERPSSLFFTYFFVLNSSQHLMETSESSSSSAAASGSVRKRRLSMCANFGPTAAPLVSASWALKSLKQECDLIGTRTVAAVVADQEVLKSGLYQMMSVATYQDGPTAPTDRSNEKEREATQASWDAIVTKQFFSAQTRTIEFTLDPERCLELSIALNRALELTVRTDVVNLVGEDKAKNRRVFPGGWNNKEGYKTVSASTFSKAEQDNCVIPISKTQIPVFFEAFPLAAEVAVEATKLVMTSLQDHPVDLEQIHLLWGWNTHSHFGYHQDHIPMCMTLTVLLSLGESSMHVAGAPEEAKYGLGTGQLFAGDMFHRSGYTQRRTVKMSLFFKRASV